MRHESPLQEKEALSPAVVSKRRLKAKPGVVDESTEIPSKQVRTWFITPPPKRSRTEPAALPAKRPKRNYDLPLLANDMSSDLLSLWKLKDGEATTPAAPAAAAAAAAVAVAGAEQTTQTAQATPSPAPALALEDLEEEIDTPADRDVGDADVNFYDEDDAGEGAVRMSVRDSLGSALWTEEDGPRTSHADVQSDKAASLRSEKVEHALVKIFASNGNTIDLRHLTEQRPKKLAARMVLEVLALTTRSCLEIYQPVSYARVQLTPTPKLGQ